MNRIFFLVIVLIFSAADQFAFAPNSLVTYDDFQSGRLFDLGGE